MKKHTKVSCEWFVRCFFINHQLRTRRALLQIKDVPLRTRRALLPLTLYSNSALLVLNGTSLSCNNSLLALNWRNTIAFSYRYIAFCCMFDCGARCSSFLSSHRFHLVCILSSYLLFYILKNNRAFLLKGIIIHNCIASFSLQPVYNKPLNLSVFLAWHSMMTDIYSGRLIKTIMKKYMTL